MRKFGGKLWNTGVMFMRGMKMSAATPYSDKWAWISLTMWSLVTGVWVLTHAFDLWGWITTGESDWGAMWIISLVTMIFDVTMLRWAIQGIGFRRQQRKREAEIKEFFEFLAGANFFLQEDGTIRREDRNGEDDRGRESGPEGRAGS